MRRIATLVFLTSLAVLAPACGKNKKPRLSAEAPARVTTLGINAYLWRAALDTIAFMPLAQVDSNGGVIITDWFKPPGAGGERFKATAYILGRTLRADGLKVVVFRQVRQGNVWTEAQPSPDTAHKLEDSILTRARELRLASVSAN